MLANTVIVSPDIGGVKRADKMADLLGLKLAIIDKVRKAHDQADVPMLLAMLKVKEPLLLTMSLVPAVQYALLPKP